MTRPRVGIEPENMGSRRGPNSGRPNADPACMRAPGAIPSESKLTSSLAIQMPDSSDFPLGDLQVKVPVAVTDLLLILNVPTPLIS